MDTYYEISPIGIFAQTSVLAKTIGSKLMKWTLILDVPMLVNIKGQKDSIMKNFQLTYIVPNFLQLLSILYNGCLEYLEGVCAWNKYSWTKIYSPTKIVDFEKDHMGFYLHWCNGVCRSRNKECCKL